MWIFLLIITSWFIVYSACVVASFCSKKEEEENLTNLLKQFRENNRE